MEIEQAKEILDSYRQNNSNYDEETVEAIDVVLAELEKKDKVIDKMADYLNSIDFDLQCENVKGLCLDCEYDNKINCIKKYYEVEEIEEITENKKRWRAEKEGSYWAVNIDGEVIDYADFGSEFDIYLYNTGNYFETKEEAEEYKQKLLYRQQYIDYLREREEEKVNWGDSEQYKYYTEYNMYSNEITSNAWARVGKKQGIIYTTRKGSIQEFIDLIGENNFKKYILEVD